MVSSHLVKAADYFPRINFSNVLAEDIESYLERLQVKE